jgi:ABC-type transporter Mla maintaining outer membrane lipid asymmetry ATPase subunit MlaF
MTTETAVDALPLTFEGIPLGLLPGAERSGSDPRAIFSLEVRPHETVVVLGDQSTGVDKLAGLALGLDPVPAGRVLVWGTEIATLSRVKQLAFRRRVGYLPAGDGLLQNLSLRDNIRLPLRFGSDFQPDEIEGRVDVILAQLRLRAVAHLRPAAATEEERRRAAMGRALAFDPELVVLDQPFDGLADRTAAELLEVARGGDLAEGGRRTLLITGQDLPAMLRPRVERLIRLGAQPAGTRT